MSKISGKKTLDKLDERYNDFVNSHANKPMSVEMMMLISFLEVYRAEANYYHDKFIECLYVS